MTSASFLSSDSARTLGSLVQDLARQWTANMHTCDDVNIVFDALRAVVARAISTVATEWNNGHDALRVLPPEVQESCFGSLPVSDRCRLPLVCSHWQQNVSNLPGVWNRLSFTDWKPRISALLARSGQVPLDLIVHIRRDPMPWESTLRSTAGRIRKLELCINSSTLIALAFPAPLLEELSITAEHHNSLEISEVLFDRHAPLLHTLRLTRLSVPPVCPALRSVTSLVLTSSRAPLDRLFEVMPRVQFLDIDTHGYAVGLPALPRQSPLRVLRLLDAYMSVDELVQLGYTGLDVLDVTTTTANTSQFVDALSCWSNLSAALRVREDWEFEIVQHPADGRRVRFAVRPYKFDVFQQIFCDGRATVHHIQHLVLPLSLRDGPYAPPCPVLLAQTSVLALPALRTLVLECGGMRYGENAFALRKCMLGKVAAPRLERIELVRPEGAPRDALTEPVDAADLAALVENVTVCDNRGALEIFVDTAAGIALGGDIDRLRTCVGKLLV